MSKRVLVTVAPQADPSAVIDALRSAGATRVTGPQPELPGVAVAEIPDDDAASIERFNSLPGVQHAELDELRWSL